MAALADPLPLLIRFTSSPSKCTHDYGSPPMAVPSHGCTLPWPYPPWSHLLTRPLLFLLTLLILISFQGDCAQVLLPPTRSIAMVKDRLVRMPCGGGSSLAHALNMAATIRTLITPNTLR